MSKCKQRGRACSSCPFSKLSERGALGGSPITTYIGQSIGPFMLPCHQADNYKGNDTPMTPEHEQCAGAAIFRRNIGADKLMPDPLLKLETEDPNVFEGMPEFIYHHCPGIDEHIVGLMIAGSKVFLHNEIAIATGKGKPPVPSSELAKQWEEASDE